MKFFVAFASLITVACAQTIAIGAPSNGDTITPGSQLTVEVDRPDTLTGSQEVAIAITLATCPANNPCTDMTERLGATLYTGPYNPQFPPFPTPRNIPLQNFTVTVPESLQAGQKAVLSVSHFSLVGAGPFDLFEIKNVTLNVGAGAPAKRSRMMRV
ncbi:hypothetical protein EWM64_g6468 [Hericium alpestre]|uniref:Phosphatidylglycerol/phosphatidylinositol transfer protein n=1 Tax=Hericium alpestre TaxID=135208 RepID=A0A4Y9ZTI1_9AGAM|nr:hypothetical protein EWM64_g6468 [Hericium alpestre]